MNFYDPLLQELYEAGLQLRPFLRTSDDREGEFADLNEASAWMKTKLATTEAQRLRQRAEEEEARDAAISRFRAALDTIRG